MADANLNLVFLEDDEEDSEFTIEHSRMGSSITYYDEPDIQFLSSSEGDDEDVRPIILCSDSSEEEQHLDVEQHSDQEQYYDDSESDFETISESDFETDENVTLGMKGCANYQRFDVIM